MNGRPNTRHVASEHHGRRHEKRAMNYIQGCQSISWLQPLSLLSGKSLDVRVSIIKGPSEGKTQRPKNVLAPTKFSLWKVNSHPPQVFRYRFDLR